MFLRVDWEVGVALILFFFFFFVSHRQSLFSDLIFRREYEKMHKVLTKTQIIKNMSKNMSNTPNKMYERNGSPDIFSPNNSGK